MNMELLVVLAHMVLLVAFTKEAMMASTIKLQELAFMDQIQSQ
jgi:hypothetical protein